MDNRQFSGLVLVAVTFAVGAWAQQATTASSKGTIWLRTDESIVA
jgi:hypothetical protein